MNRRQIKNRNKRAMMYNMGGYKSRYNLGGMYSNPINPAMYADTVGGGIRKPAGPQGPMGGPPMPEQPPRPGIMQMGGMYADNTVAGTGQGMGPRDTAVTVFQESDPRLQEQRIKSLQDEESRLRQASSQAVTDAERMKEEGSILGERAALEGMQQFQQTASTIETAATAPIASKLAAGKSAVFKGAADAYRIQRAANLAQKAKLATDAAKAAQYADKANKLLQVGKAGTEGARTLGSVTATGANVGTVSGAAAGTTAAGTGSALAAGAKSFLSSGAGLGLVASGLGYGVKKLWADDDPTTFDAGDAVGSALSGAGTGMAIGSVVPVIGTAVGGIVGGLYGLGKSFFGSKKAKREQERAEEKQKRKIKKAVDKHNKETMKAFTSQKSAVRAGELAQKTYSGYDLGQNVVAQMGGMRMGTPRYGYAAA